MLFIFRLDQQIWGSEDEDIDEEQNNKKDKEQKGKGESTGEKEMGAKEEEQGQDDGTEGKEKKKKDINEMQEPEIDDDQVRRKMLKSVLKNVSGEKMYCNCIYFTVDYKKNRNIS